MKNQDINTDKEIDDALFGITCALLSMKIIVDHKPKNGVSISEVCKSIKKAKSIESDRNQKGY